MIKAVKEWTTEAYEREVNGLLSQGFVIVQTECGFEGNEEGRDAVFIAILCYPEELG